MESPQLELLFMRLMVMSACMIFQLETKAKCKGYVWRPNLSSTKLIKVRIMLIWKHLHLSRESYPSLNNFSSGMLCVSSSIDGMLVRIGHSSLVAIYSSKRALEIMLTDNTLLT